MLRLHYATPSIEVGIATERVSAHFLVMMLFLTCSSVTSLRMWRWAPAAPLKLRRFWTPSPRQRELALSKNAT